MRIPRGLTFHLLALAGVSAASASAQEIPLAPQQTVQVCPGAFPTDLTATDCRYTPKQRTLDFLTGSVTDQAGLGAVFYGLGAQIIQSPPEWKRTWYGYGQRVGVRYTQAVGKGTAQYLSGLLLNDDPRFLAYRNDPEVIRRRQEAVRDLPAGNRTLDQMTHDGWQRFGHAWYDVITVRRSTRSGDGRRIPAISRFAGEFAGAYAGYPWYPASENNFVNVGQRAAGAFGTAVLSSFWTEYHVEVTNVLGALLHRNSPSNTAGGNP
jgi:hypothetical protein